MFLVLFYSFAVAVFTYTIVSEVKDARKYRKKLEGDRSL